MVQGQTHSFNFFYLSVLRTPTMRTLSETSNDHALRFTRTRNHGNTLVHLLHCLSLSACQFESTFPPAAHLLPSQSQQGGQFGHHLRLSNFLERISRPSCEALYATNTSHYKQVTFLHEYPCMEFLPAKNAQ
jgi:hypothetical protein